MSINSWHTASNEPRLLTELNDYDERAVLLEGIKGFLALVDANHEDISLARISTADRAHVEPRAGRRSAKKSRKLIIRMAKENRSCGYDRIVGALANLGHQVSDQTVGNVLRRHGIPPATERRGTTTWAEFIRAHLAVLAGTDSFHGGGPRAARTGDLPISCSSSIWRAERWRSPESPPTR